MKPIAAGKASPAIPAMTTHAIVLVSVDIFLGVSVGFASVVVVGVRTAAGPGDALSLRL